MAKSSLPISGNRIEFVKLTVIVPNFNEGSSIRSVVQSLIGVLPSIPMEIIVVDDGSSDDSVGQISDLAAAGSVAIICHERNMGKGAAIRTGLEIASGSHVVVFDADDEYTPSDLHRMIEALSRPRVVVVYGSRIHNAETRHPSFIYYLGNRLMTLGANVLFNSALSDLHTCLKLFPTALVRTFTLTEDGFGFDSEITGEMLRRGIRPFEVPVSYNGRSRLEGKKIHFGDSLRSVWVLIKVRLRRGEGARFVEGSKLPA